MVVLKSKRGRPMVLFNDYTYTHNGENSTGTNWTCSSRRSKNCKATIKTIEDKILHVSFQEHNHEAPKYVITNDGSYVRI